MSSDHKRMKLEIKNKSKFGKFACMWKLNNSPKITRSSKKKVQEKLLWDKWKWGHNMAIPIECGWSSVGEQFRAVNACVKKEETFKSIT